MLTQDRIEMDLTGTMDLTQILARIARLKEVIVVNIAEDAVEEAVFFSLENLQAIIGNGRKKIFLETMAEHEYRDVLQQQLGYLMEGLNHLLVRLRDEYIADISPEVAEFLGQMQNITSILASFSHQRPHVLLQKDIFELQLLVEQTGAACFHQEDTARCMDNLHYEILPILQKIAGKVGPVSG